MAKTILMSFPKRVRYKHIQYPPNTAFRVDEQDVVNLTEAGGWVIEEPTEQEVTTTTKNVEPEEPKASGTAKKSGRKTSKED